MSSRFVNYWLQRVAVAVVVCGGEITVRYACQRFVCWLVWARSLVIKLLLGFSRFLTGSESFCLLTRMMWYRFLSDGRFVGVCSMFHIRRIAVWTKQHQKQITVSHNSSTYFLYPYTLVGFSAIKPFSRLVAWKCSLSVALFDLISV